MQPTEFIGEHLLPGQIGYFLSILSFVASLVATFSFAKAFYAKEMGRVFNVLQDVIGLNDRHITIILEHLNYGHEKDE